jgi:integrase
MPIVKPKLTKKIIAHLRGRPATDKSKEPLIHFCGSMPGFGVSVSTKTGLKSYVVQRDLPNNGKTRRITIGRVSEHFPLEQARKEADELIRQMNKGIDPKTVAKGEVTLKQAADAYLATSPNLSERSKRDYARVFDVYLADWRDVKLGAITRAMVEARHLELGKEHPATANSVMRTLRAVHNWAADDRYANVGANPVKFKKRQWFNVPRRERHVSADQLPAFHRAVLELENEVARDFILLLLWSGLRREEAAGLRWSEVDLTAEVIRLPSLRTKARRKLDVPLSDVVLRLLKARRALGDAEFVFPARSRSGRIAEPKDAFVSIAEATGIVVSCHDLRRTFAGAAVAAGVHGLHLKALLNHALGEEGDVTSGYIILNAHDLRLPMQRVADQLKRWCKVPEPWFVK